MASKTGKKANAASKRNNAPVEKDDGTRWIVTRGAQQVYPGPGVMKGQAERLAEGLVEPADVTLVD